MRLAIASWTARRVGGVEDYLSILLPALAETGVEIAFWHEVDTPLDRAPVPVPSGAVNICAAVVGRDASIEQLRSWKPDVIYSQGVQDPVAEAMLLDLAPAVLFVHTYMGTCISGTKTFSRPVERPCARTFGWTCLAHYFPHGCGGNSPGTMWRLFNVQSTRLELLSRYRAVLTHTDHMRDEMSKHGIGATVVPYPIATGAAGDVESGDGTCRLLFAGRMERLKGGHYLLEALPEIVPAVGRPVRVTFAGDGTERERWERRAGEIQATTPNLVVEFTGWIPQQRVASLMARADLLVVPSLWPEPFGAVGPAAAQHGLPAAAFASGGITQWLESGVTGHLAPADPPTSSGLARAVIRCLEDPIHYAALRAAARQMAGRFTMERHLPALMSQLERA